MWLRYVDQILDSLYYRVTYDPIILVHSAQLSSKLFLFFYILFIRLIFYLVLVKGIEINSANIIKGTWVNYNPEIEL